MVEMSKMLFNEYFAHQDCRHLLHPWGPGCWTSSLTLYKDALIGSAKFYSIVYLIQIIMRGRKMRQKEQWIKMAEYYVRSTLLGQLVTATASNISCTLRKLMGDKFTYHTYLLIPFTVNGLFIYLEHPSRRGLVINLFVNLYIEYWLRSFKKAGYISITKTQQTLLFMIGSSLLFYLMRLEGDKKQRTPLFWLYTPEKVRRKSDSNENPCPHNGPCDKYITKGFATYFSVGLGITLARVILPRIRSPLKAISSIRGQLIQTVIEEVEEAKNKCNNQTLKFKSLYMLHKNYAGWDKIYSDGSQTPQGCGAAYYVPSHNVRESYKICNSTECSIMYVELFAISEALSYVISNGLNKAVILSDSRSALQHVARCASGHRGAAIAYTILRKVSVLTSRGVALGLQWIPSHVGIHGNEEADKLARDAISNGAEVYIKPEHSELLVKYKCQISQQWKEHFDVVSREKGIWYRTMISDPPRIPWFANTDLDRNSIVMAHRLRSGHIPTNRFKFLMKTVDSPNCTLCNRIEDIHHVLSECVRTATMRQELIKRYNISNFNVGIFQTILSAQTSEAARLAVVCYLCRIKGFDSATYALPAGYLAGLSFMMSPSLGIAIGSVTAAMKLYSTILYEKKIIPTSIPLPEILYCICQGTLFNARVLHPDVCPKYVFNLMETVSNGRSKSIVKNVNEVLARIPQQ